jgi:hypothetical protein
MERTRTNFDNALQQAREKMRSNNNSQPGDANQ